MDRPSFQAAAAVALAAWLCLPAAPAQAAGPPAGAGCLSDADRAASATGRAAEEQRGRTASLVADAAKAAQAGDGAGCRKAADEALRTAGLPPLAPILLSTSIANENRGASSQVPAPPRPGASAGSAPGNTASTQAAPPPAQTASTQPAPGQPAPAQPAPAQPAPAAPAAAPPPAAPAASAAAPSNAWLVTARDLLGKRVVAAGNDAQELGVIQDLILEGASGGQVRYVVLRQPGILGSTALPTIDRPADVIVPIGALRFSARGDMARMDATPIQLRNAPGFREEDVERLQSDQAWQRSIAGYYGLAAATQAAPAPAPAAPAPQAAASPPQAAASAPRAGASAPQPTAQGAAVQQANAAPGDPAHGQSVAKVCAACHSLDKGGQIRVGPPLYGVEGRPVASVQGFSYSGALRAKGGAWDDAQLNAFLKNPRSYAPGTRMAYPGIANDRDRADVVAFLNTLK